MKCDIYKIWINHSKDLKGYVRKRVSNENDVEDILQTVLIKITNYCETKNNVKHVKAWIYKITQNTITDFYKQSNKNTKIAMELPQTTDTHEFDENIYSWLHTFIDQLPAAYAEPLKLSDIEGVPQKTIADQLGLTLVATKSRIQRARKKLKEKFDECGEMEHIDNQTLSFTVTKSCCLA